MIVNGQGIQTLATALAMPVTASATALSIVPMTYSLLSWQQRNETKQTRQNTQLKKQLDPPSRLGENQWLEAVSVAGSQG